MKMKKGLVALVFFSLGLSGCGDSQGLEVDKVDLESFEGVLSLQKSNDEYLGTHLLETEDGEVVPLRSLDLNLSRKEYLGNVLKVEGFFNEDEVFQVMEAQVLELNGETSDLGRKSVYVNDDLGFEIGYFSGWEQKEGKAEVSFVNKDGEVITVRQKAFAYVPTTFEDGSVDSALAAYVYGLGKSYSENDLLYVGSDGYEAVKFLEGKEVVYAIYRAGFVYEVAAVVTEKESEMVFNEMLSTFAFTTFDLGHDESEVQDEDSGYDLSSVFESLPYSFRGAYPGDWYYSGERVSDSGVLHRYSFSDDVVSADNILITLDVLSDGGMPSGESLNVGGNVVVVSGGGREVRTSLGDKGFRLKGASEYRDLMVAIAGSLVKLED